MRRTLPLLLLPLLAACAGATRAARVAPIVPRSIADSVRTEPLAPGVFLHSLVQLQAPWRAWVLDVSLDACVSPRAVKGGATAVGRTTTSALLQSIPQTERPIAAVNADFFLFAPPGVPVGAHVEQGRLVSGPVARPVFAMTEDGRAWIGELAAEAALQTPRGAIALTTWNRPMRGRAGLVDAAWGVALDSTLAQTVWRLVPVRGASGSTTNARYVASSFTRARDTKATGDTLLVVELPAGATASATLRDGDTVRVTRAMLPHAVREAVGGFPWLVRDSVIAGAVDSANNAAFRGLNPRTALGIASNGRRLLVAVIDGRQPNHSVGMTLRETASLLRDLGAHTAVNLDGGGSSAMVVLETDGGTRRTRVVNRPSDAGGERPVANALAFTGTCARR